MLYEEIHNFNVIVNNHIKQQIIAITISNYNYYIMNILEIVRNDKCLTILTFSQSETFYSLLFLSSTKRVPSAFIDFKFKNFIYR